MSKKFRCPFCERKTIYTQRQALLNHIDEKHGQLIPEGITAAQVLFNVKNKYPIFQTHGKSIISGKPTEWNEKINRYERLANDKEKEEFRKQFVARMQKRYGKDHLLDDSKVQRKMLANRRISGTYQFPDGGELEYVGSYEKHFLMTMDTVFNWPSSDIISPAPIDIVYTDKDSGKERVYIPDFYIQSLDLLVEIKSAENKHYRQRDISTEESKDAAVNETKHNYVKILDKKYGVLLEEINRIRYSN